MNVYILNIEADIGVFDSLEKALASFDNFVKYRNAFDVIIDIDETEEYTYLQYSFQVEGGTYHYMADITSCKLNDDIFDL